jgi:hypothetical protein
MWGFLHGKFSVACEGKDTVPQALLGKAAIYIMVTHKEASGEDCCPVHCKSEGGAAMWDAPSFEPRPRAMKCSCYFFLREFHSLQSGCTAGGAASRGTSGAR